MIHAAYSPFRTSAILAMRIRRWSAVPSLRRVKSREWSGRAQLSEPTSFSVHFGWDASRKGDFWRPIRSGHRRSFSSSSSLTVHFSLQLSRGPASVGARRTSLGLRLESRRQNRHIVAAHGRPDDNLVSLALRRCPQANLPSGESRLWNQEVETAGCSISLLC